MNDDPVQFSPQHTSGHPVSQKLLDYTVSSLSTAKTLKSHDRFQLQIQQVQEIYWRGTLELLPLTLIALIKMVWS